MEKCVNILDVEAICWTRRVLRCILHDEMKHCCLVCFIEEPIGCPKAVRNGAECVSHQLVKIKGLVKVMGLDEQHKGKVTSSADGTGLPVWSNMRTLLYILFMFKYRTSTEIFCTY